HCRYVHFMVLDYHTIKDINAVIGVNNPERFCAQCKHFFGRKPHFKGHPYRCWS
ncbi:hypothetical protein V8B55DRAFT_1323767, partial [Mucor lusitanicus]